MFDDYPEPPPPPARCPSCNEELTDHPRPDLFFLDDSGAICDGPDGCGWWGTRQQAEEYALDVGEAHAEAMADDGPGWRSSGPRRAIPMPGVVPFEEDAELSRWLARHGYESADDWMRDSGYALSDGGWFTLDGLHGPFEPADAMAGAMEAEMLALAAEGGWDGRRGACIITEANTGTEDDCTTHDHEADEEAAWEVTIVLNVEGATPEDALAEWVACNGVENLPIAAAVRS